MKSMGEEVEGAERDGAGAAVEGWEGAGAGCRVGIGGSAGAALEGAGTAAG